MDKITEIIPDDIPDWMTEGIANGTLFKTVITLVESQAQEIKRLHGVLSEIDKHEIKSTYERCPDCWSSSLDCSKEKGCVQFTQKGHKTAIQKLIEKALEKLQ